MRGVAEVILGAHAHAIDQGRGKVGQLRLAQHQGQVAALGNLQRVGNGRRNVGKQCQHLRAGLEVLLAGEAAYTALVAQDFAVGDADAGLVRLVIRFFGELHRVGGYHGKLQAGGQLHGGYHMGFVVGAACALQFNVEALWEYIGQLEGHRVGPHRIVLHQGLPYGPSLGTGQTDQPSVELTQPGKFDNRLVFNDVLGKSAGQKFR